MKVCTCFLLLGIFAYTNSISWIRRKGDHRVFNLPQDIVGEYSYEEYSGDTNTLDNVHNIITSGTTVQDKNKNIKLAFRAPRVETLTDFIQEAVTILNTYEDTAFEDFFHILDDEMRKYYYRGCKFSELTQNSDSRSLLFGSLNSIRGKSVSFMKANINEVADMMRDERYDKHVKELLDYINSLYIYNKPNFHSILNELRHYRKTKSIKTHNKLVKVIRGGVRNILFDYYTELNNNTRRELKERIETFWKRIKNIPASSAEMNDIPYTDSVKSVVNSIKALSNPKYYSKNDPQMKLKKKIEKSGSKKTYGEVSQHDETEKDESSNEAGKQTNYNTDEISSGLSFDSSSNSIKNSQERHEEYNTQRYMTLYTEEISYKAKSTKKTEIIPLSANVMTRRPKVKKQLTTTSTPRERDVSSDREKIEMLKVYHDADDTKMDISNSSHDTESSLMLESKHEPRAKVDYDKQGKHGKTDELRSKSKHKNVEITSQYNAVIDVQLTNTELLKALRMFEPLGMDTQYDTGLHPRSDIQTKKVSTKSKFRPRSMRARPKIKLQNPTAHTKSPSRYSKRNKPFYIKQLSDLRKNKAPSLSNEGHPVDQFMRNKNQNQKYFRRSDNDTIGAEEFITYVMKRINAMENELNKLIQMNDLIFRSRINDNNTYRVEAANVTHKFEVKDKVDSKRKDMKVNVIERYLNKDHDLNNTEVNDGHEFTTRNNTMYIESSTINTKSRKLNDILKNAVNATVIDNKNTTQVTNNIRKINVNVTEKLNKEVINYNVTKSTISLVKVTNATNLESVVTTPTVGVIKSPMASSEPSYYDPQQENHPTVRNSQFDQFFDHVNDDVDLHM